ncbi:MAG: reverse transcriptase/maturase family protein [Candidatus Levybacteria bacterium]|nr:reverse transcriptase/maturase family protein [Candidatus Levybacteria bacterium]
MHIDTFDGAEHRSVSTLSEVERVDYSKLISIENLFQAWKEFRKGKAKRFDVAEFERNLEDNLFELHLKLKNKSYKHGGYESFYVHDPKQRHIHKASVIDRVVHHLLYTFLYKLFDRVFIYDSYSCRLNKGTHKGVKRLAELTRKVSKNYTRPCFALKLDIKKFFASVDHEVLLTLLKKKVKDKDIIWLLVQIINSFYSDKGEGKGMPLGNLTSQVFANIYLNELDQFTKHKLKVKYYLRYADDFLFLSKNKELLCKYIDVLRQFLSNGLKLELHPNKIIFRKLEWGIDFLGYIVLPHYILPRTKTRKRIFKKLKENVGSENFNQSLQSYLGYLGHASSFKIAQSLLYFYQKYSL